MDETPVQVLKEPNKPAQSKSYMWVMKGGPPQHPVVLFRYDPSRAQTVPKEWLDGYAGYLQTDGYAGYNVSAHSSTYLTRERRVRQSLRVCSDPIATDWP